LKYHGTINENHISFVIMLISPEGASSWGLHLIVVRRFEYADDPESYTSGSVVTGRVSHAGKVEG
jgi:hypothetical protein